MPTPIIELQRRLTLVGEIRIGGEKQPKRPGAKLEAFRLTSQTRSLVEQASKLYGGKATSWTSPQGEAWQVYTESAELPVLIMPSHSLTQRYELWEGATQRLRVCDGYSEDVSGGACLCVAEGFDRCDIYTRLVVALPELDTVLGWRLITRGANAAHELPTMLALIERVSNGATFVPAKLRIDQRRSVKDGQVVRYVVPTLDLGLSYLAFAGRDEARSLTSGQEQAREPLEGEPSTAKTFALGAALRDAPDPPSSGVVAREAEFGPTTPPPPTPGFATVDREEVVLTPNEPTTFVAPPPREETTMSEPQTRWPTGPQKKKLNVLVGKLREAGHIDTRGLYRAIAKLREVDPNELLAEVGGFYAIKGEEEARMHWTPLREALTRPEAVQLIDWLEQKQAQVAEVAR